MTIATPPHAQVGSYPIHGHEGAEYVCGLPHCETGVSRRTTTAARIEAIAWGVKTVLVEIKPRRRPSEDEIVLAAITVILVALGTIIALAAAAVLTMG
jgi:hypothetical protein